MPITNSLPYINNWTLPSPIDFISKKANLSPQSQKIVSIATKALKELVIAFAFNLTILAFTAAPVLSIPVLTSALIGALAGVIVSTAWDIYRNNKVKDANFKQQLSLELIAAKTDKVAHLAIANAVGMSGPNIAIHEGGHALSAMAFFKNSKPSIEITPFVGGQTSYEISGLTRLGRLIGEEKACLFTAAGGLLASTVFVMFEIACAHGLKDSYPTISECLNYHAMTQLMNEVIYGLTALFISHIDLAHDFVYLHQMGGIHPLVVIAVIIALPLAEICLLKWLESRKCKEIKQPVNTYC